MSGVWPVLIAYFQCLYICRYLSLYRVQRDGKRNVRVAVDMRNYCEYLQGNYFVLTELVSCVCHFWQNQRFCYVASNRMKVTKVEILWKYRLVVAILPNSLVVY